MRIKKEAREGFFFMGIGEGGGDFVGAGFYPALSIEGRILVVGADDPVRPMQRVR